MVSFRLGGTDGVAVEAAKWAWALEQLGWRVTAVAGEGPVDTVVPGLAIDATHAPDLEALTDALVDAELVVVENLLSLPLNPQAAGALAQVLADRPAVLHHHDLPWQRQRFAGCPPPPHDRRWVHVTVNELSKRQLAERGIEAVVVRNAFDTEAKAGDRLGTRRALPVEDGERLLLQPTRAIARKNVGVAIELAQAVGATYWLLGEAEEGYGPELERLLSAASVRTICGQVPGSRRSAPRDAYAACDVVALPSTWEGFGNPSIESAVFRKPLVIGRYPVADELAAFGFRWFHPEDVDQLATLLSKGDEELLDHNFDVARRHFSLAELPGRLEPVVTTAVRGG